MRKVYRPRKIGTIDYASGQRKTLEIDRDGILTGLLVRVQYTVTNGATGPVGPLFQTLGRIIRKLEVRVAGRDTVVSMSGEMLSALAHVENSVPCDGMDDTVVLTNSAVTAYDVTIPVPMTLPRARRPDDTALDLRAVTQANVALTWANSDCSDLFTTPNSAAISLVTCSVHGEYHMPVEAVSPRIIGVRQVVEVEKELTATNPKFQVTIDGRTGLIARTLALAALVDNIGDNAILSSGSLKVQSGSFVYQEVDGPVVQAMNRHGLAVQNLITGFYYAPLIDQGELNQAINTSPNVLPGDLLLLLDATKQSGTNKFLAAIEAVRPPDFPTP